MMRWLTVALIALLAVITVTSAYIRLVQAGVGCQPWPACYGPSEQAKPALHEDDPLFVPRAVHRVTASVAALLVVIVVFVGWGSWDSRRGRNGLIALLLLTAGLSWLGIITPSRVPAVTIGNLLGGVLLLALALRLLMLLPQQAPKQAPMLASAEASIDTALRRTANVALVMTLVQIVLGATIVARYGAAACNSLPGCETLEWLSGAGVRVFNPFARDEPVTTGALQLTHIAHRIGAVLVALIAIRLGWVARRMSGMVHWLAYAVLGMVIVQIATGAALALMPGLPLALAHNIGATVLLAALAVLATMLAARPGISVAPTAALHDSRLSKLGAR